MLPVNTPDSNFLFVLEGGDESNDLPVERTRDADEQPVIRSVWGLTDEERAAIAAGANVYLVVWGMGHPPVALGVTDPEYLGDREVMKDEPA